MGEVEEEGPVVFSCVVAGTADPGGGGTTLVTAHCVMTREAPFGTVKFTATPSGFNSAPKKQLNIGAVTVVQVA